MKHTLRLILAACTLLAASLPVMAKPSIELPAPSPIEVPEGVPFAEESEAPPVVLGPQGPLTLLVPEPTQSRLARLSWRISSASPVLTARVFVNQYWPPPAGRRDPAGPFNPITIEEDFVTGESVLSIQIWVHPLFRWPGMWFPPMAYRSTQSWSLDVETAGGTVSTQETFILILPTEQGTAFVLER